ncbi:hypothetical protein, partial [Streptomyces sparsus]
AVTGGVLSTAVLVALLGAAPARAESGSSVPASRFVGTPFTVDTTVRTAQVKATRAARAHARARQAAERQQRTVSRLNRSLHATRAEYQGLRRVIGAAAAEQYRTGMGTLLPGARLVLADSPEEFLARSAILERGNRAAEQFRKTVRRAETEIARKRGAADRALTRLRREQARKRALAVHLAAQLSRARLERAQRLSGRA